MHIRIPNPTEYEYMSTGLAQYWYLCRCIATENNALRGVTLLPPQTCIMFCYPNTILSIILYIDRSSHQGQMCSSGVKILLTWILNRLTMNDTAIVFDLLLLCNY